MDTQELLDRVKVKLGVDTDYKLAKKLDIPDARISEYRNGKRVPNNYAIAKFAKVLEVDPWTLVREIEAQTEKNPARREFWRKAAVFLLGGFLNVNLLMTPTPAEAAPIINKSLNALYIMLNIKRHIRWLKQRFLQALQVCIPEPLSRPLVPRVDHVTA